MISTGSMFTPIERPVLEHWPDAAEASSFLVAYDHYSREVAHRRRNLEGSDEIEPIQFCIQFDLFDFICFEEPTIAMELAEHGVVSDQVLREWLASIVAATGFRTLPEIFRMLQPWPSQVGSLDRQVLFFMKDCFVVLRDSRAAATFSEKSIIQNLQRR